MVYRAGWDTKGLVSQNGVEDDRPYHEGSEKYCKEMEAVWEHWGLRSKGSPHS